jgi:hypothetical protein
MIYLMTAFFLDFNHAHWLWWAGFIAVGLFDHYLYLTRDLNEHV